MSCFETVFLCLGPRPRQDIQKFGDLRLLSWSSQQDWLRQETHLSLTNRATHLCKCNDVADLTNVIKIRLKKIDSSNPAFQGHSRSLELTRIDPPSVIPY